MHRYTVLDWYKKYTDAKVALTTWELARTMKPPLTQKNTPIATHAGTLLREGLLDSEPAPKSCLPALHRYRINTAGRAALRTNKVKLVETIEQVNSYPEGTYKSSYLKTKEKRAARSNNDHIANFMESMSPHDRLKFQQSTEAATIEYRLRKSLRGCVEYTLKQLLAHGEAGKFSYDEYSNVVIEWSSYNPLDYENVDIDDDMDD